MMTGLPFAPNTTGVAIDHEDRRPAPGTAVAVQAEAAEARQATHDERLTALTARVHTIKTAKADALADTRSLKAIALASGDNHPAQVVIEAPGGFRASVGEVAHAQFSDRLKIDKRYYDRMVTEAPELLADNLNWWMAHTPEERLLRFLRPTAFTPEEQRVMASLGVHARLRGVLGKGYRTIDDADLVDAIVPTLVERGALLTEFSIDERRLHAKFFTAARDAQTIKQAYAAKYNVSVEAVGRHLKVDGKDISWVNETLSAGVTIRHSEVGYASLGAAFVTRILKCLNDYVAEQSVAIRHVGGKHGSADEDVRFLSGGTQMLENAALIGRVQDTVAAELSDDAIARNAIKVLAAKTELVLVPSTMPLFEFIGDVGAGLNFTTEQTEQLKEATLESIHEEAQGITKFSLVQGITAVARQMTDYDRRLDVERAGFRFLNDDATALVKLARDAERKGRN